VFIHGPTVNEMTPVKILFLFEKQIRIFICFCGKIKKALADMQSVTPCHLEHLIFL